MSNLENYMKQQAIFCEQNDSISKNLYSEYGVKSLVSNVVFIDKHDGKALRMDASFAQMGIGDGTKLVLL